MLSKWKILSKIIFFFLIRSVFMELNYQLFCLTISKTENFLTFLFPRGTKVTDKRLTQVFLGHADSGIEKMMD